MLDGLRVTPVRAGGVTSNCPQSGKEMTTSIEEHPVSLRISWIFMRYPLSTKPIHYNGQHAPGRLGRRTGIGDSDFELESSCRSRYPGDGARFRIEGQS